MRVKEEYKQSSRRVQREYRERTKRVHREYKEKSKRVQREYEERTRRVQEDCRECARRAQGVRMKINSCSCMKAVLSLQMHEPEITEPEIQGVQWWDQKLSHPPPLQVEPLGQIQPYLTKRPPGKSTQRFLDVSVSQSVGCSVGPSVPTSRY